MYHQGYRSIDERVALIEADLMRQPIPSSFGVIDRVSRWEFDNLKKIVRTHAMILIVVLMVLTMKLLWKIPIEVPAT